jgi:hypothetical protein
MPHVDGVAGARDEQPSLLHVIDHLLGDQCRLVLCLAVLLVGFALVGIDAGEDEERKVQHPG